MQSVVSTVFVHQFVYVCGVLVHLQEQSHREIVVLLTSWPSHRRWCAHVNFPTNLENCRCQRPSGVHRCADVPFHLPCGTAACYVMLCYVKLRYTVVISCDKNVTGTARCEVAIMSIGELLSSSWWASTVCCVCSEIASICSLLRICFIKCASVGWHGKVDVPFHCIDSPIFRLAVVELSDAMHRRL